MSFRTRKSRKIALLCGILALSAAFLTGPVQAADAGAKQTASAPAAAPAKTEEAKRPPFTIMARAVSPATLLAGQTPIRLWGIEPVEVADPAVKLKARIALDNIMGGKKISCELKGRTATDLEAQCVNAGDQDLSLYMLQQGYVTADRAAVYGTVFEDAYIQAETQAQDKSIGVWAPMGAAAGGGRGNDGTLMLSFGFVLFLCIIVAFVFLSIIIMRGFQKVVDAQNDNIAMMTKERKLRDQEREVVAVMLDSELKANKAKIEAYLAVYEEMLRSMKDPDRPPKFKKSGDIVQRQPALGRAVFDRNTDKIDVLGGRLSSELVHFYARIKSNPEYVNLEPDMEVDEALEVVERSLKHARRLNDLTAKLLDSFAASGIMSEKFQE
jgi:endonuclease YncB( thermonuclease family)